jgi:hypothetical protein
VPFSIVFSWGVEPNGWTWKKARRDRWPDRLSDWTLSPAAQAVGEVEPVPVFDSAEAAFACLRVRLPATDSVPTTPSSSAQVACHRSRQRATTSLAAVDQPRFCGAASLPARQSLARGCASEHP